MLRCHCLDLHSATILANSLVTSKLYCNSLLYGLPKSSIQRLQRVQNSLARVVIPSTRCSDHTTPVLKRHHWLPVAQRINFKISVITFKVLHNAQPSYLSDIINLHRPPRLLRSCDQNLFSIPHISTVLASRALSHSSPTLWNSLPPNIRSSTSLTKFRSLLKTHFFPPSPFLLLSHFLLWISTASPPTC